MYAGLSGVLYALYIGSVAPESFALDLSVLYLAMIVLGGLGSVGGAALGAVFVSALPIVFQEYAGSLPLVSEPGQGGVSPARRPACCSAWPSSWSSCSSRRPGRPRRAACRRASAAAGPAASSPRPEPAPSHTPAQGSTS